MQWVVRRVNVVFFSFFKIQRIEIITKRNNLLTYFHGKGNNIKPGLHCVRAKVKILYRLCSTWYYNNFTSQKTYWNESLVGDKATRLS